MLKAEDINSMGDAQNFVEGCLNDFEAGIMDKSEFMNEMFSYTVKIIELARQNNKNNKNDNYENSN